MVMRVVYWLGISWILTLAYAGIVGAILDYHETIAFMGTSVHEEAAVIFVYVIFADAMLALRRWING